MIMWPGFLKEYGAAAKQQCDEDPGRLHPHMFQQDMGHASLPIRDGMPLALLAEWLGHEDLKTVLVYA